MHKLNGIIGICHLSYDLKRSSKRVQYMTEIACIVPVPRCFPDVFIAGGSNSLSAPTLYAVREVRGNCTD